MYTFDVWLMEIRDMSVIEDYFFTCNVCSVVHDTVLDAQTCCPPEPEFYSCPFCDREWTAQIKSFNCCGE